ncbi:MAG TPA: DNA methyltransferase [Clostridia bacterium]|nr:DNA methyltransferase [Clostridia bacterium]
MVFDNINFIDEFGKEQKLEFNNFYCVDCMKVLKLIPDKSIDLCIVDPPYGLERYKKADGGNSKKIQCFGDSEKNWNNEKPDNTYFKELFRVSKNQIVWGGNNFDLPQSEYFIIWDKQQFMPSFARCEQAWTNCNVPAKIYSCRSQDINRIHPTQKPVALYTWLLQNYAKKGDKILDTHCGSASSLIACHKLGFDYVAFELDKDYYKASMKRLKAVKNQISIFDKVEE